LPNSYDFTGRAALVTGGVSGIGAAVAERLREGDAHVVTFDIDSRADVQGDMRSSAALAAAVAKIEAEHGRLDILVNSAGVAGDSLHTVDVSDQEWERVLGVNASGSFYACRAAIPGMVERGYGRIVLVASIAGKEGNPMAAAYSASKAAVIAMTKAIGKDLAGTGVLVNCVAPAVIESPMLEGLSQEHLDYMVERIPLGRIGRPDEVAALICWLASEDCSFSTGATFDISGGRAVY
jgi:NAD(P)-dependent dehydrogenase (short-subunit alcohol dehydrogenase family)